MAALPSVGPLPPARDNTQAHARRNRQPTFRDTHSFLFRPPALAGIVRAGSGIQGIHFECRPQRFPSWGRRRSHAQAPATPPAFYPRRSWPAIAGGFAGFGGQRRLGGARHRIAQERSGDPASHACPPPSPARAWLHALPTPGLGARGRVPEEPCYPTASVAGTPHPARCI